MFKRILVPLDGSELAELALPYALELAQKFDSRLLLLSVTPLPVVSVDPGEYPYSGYDYVPELGEHLQNETHTYLQEKQADLTAAGLAVDIQVEQGNQPAEVILMVVEEGNTDAIVMSTHGRGGVRRWMYGSVADKVLRHADVPVLLIRVPRA